MRPEKLWFITGRYGLYQGGGFLRRMDAIREHVNAIDQACYREGNTFGALTESHKRAWRKCQINGDRAVRCVVTPEAG
jgi:hypothetical protein